MSALRSCFGFDCKITPCGMDMDTEVTAKDVDVFLGGSCDTTTWRKHVAMPAFDAAGIKYFNPQVEGDGWHNGMIQQEADAKWLRTFAVRD